MKGLRVTGAIASIITVAAVSNAQASASYAAVSSTRADSSRAVVASAASDPLGAAQPGAMHTTSHVVMRADNNALSHRADDSTQYDNIVGAIRVQSVSDGAGYLVLQDGTRWKVALEDRPRVEQWHAGDYVIVRLAPIVEDGNFSYRFVNGRDESDILVAFRGMEQAAD